MHFEMSTSFEYTGPPDRSDSSGISALGLAETRLMDRVSGMGIPKESEGRRQKAEGTRRLTQDQGMPVGPTGFILTSHF
jgi:hypothetical protein